MSTQLPGMERHPDILAMREHYERVTSTMLAQGVEALCIVAGIFLAISPWVVGFALFPAAGGIQGVTLSNLICGLTFAFLLGGYATAFERTHARAYAGLALGVWTIVAPWATVGDQAFYRTIWTNCVTGAVMACLAGAAIAMAMTGMSSKMGRSRG